MYWLLTLVVATVPVLSPWDAIAQDRTVADQEAIVQARIMIQSLMDESHAPGVAVSVGIDNKLFWSEGFGYADVENEVPVLPSTTRFRIGSVSKPMTAVAIAQLYEQGLLDLDAPVQDYIPSFPLKEKGVITTRLLAGHLAGIRHYKGDEFLSSKHYPTIEGGLEIFKNDPLLFTPGSKYSYSSYGWNLISAIVEGASGREFLSYMTERVFPLAEMDNTIADYVSPIIKNRTQYYRYHQGQLENAPPVDNSYKWAGGGFLSTSEDLVRFGFAHLDPDFLEPETVQLLWKSQETTDGKTTGYGLGWRSRTDNNNRYRVGHTGGSVGGTTVFDVFPEERIVIVVIANMSDASLGNISVRLADLFIECCVE